MLGPQVILRCEFLEAICTQQKENSEVPGLAWLAALRWQLVWNKVFQHSYGYKKLVLTHAAK